MLDIKYIVRTIAGKIVEISFSDLDREINRPVIKLHLPKNDKN